MLTEKQIEQNKKNLTSVFEYADNHENMCMFTSLVTSTGEFFDVDVVATPCTDAKGNPYTDYYVTTRDMKTVEHMMQNDFRKECDADAAGIVASGRGKVIQPETGSPYCVMTSDAYIAYLSDYMQNFEAARQRDAMMKQKVYELGCSSAALSDNGKYISWQYGDAHKEVFGNSPQFGTGDQTDIRHGSVSCTFGPSIQPYDGNCKTTAVFTAEDVLTLPTLRDYCQIRNMHMLYGENVQGLAEPSYVCFTEPEALRELNPTLADWAKFEMAAGHDRMRSVPFVQTGCNDPSMLVHPEDNLSSRDRCRNAILTSNGQPVRFDAMTVNKTMGEFVCMVDTKQNISIEPHWIDNKPVKNPIVFHGKTSEMSKLLDAFDSVTMNQKNLDNALSAGYEFNGTSEQYAVAKTASPVERTYKLGKDSHGRVKFRGMALMNGTETEVTVNRKYGNHEFSDAEIKSLLAGDEITIQGFQTKTGVTTDVTGRLGVQQFQGRQFIGFTRTDMQAARRQPDGIDSIQVPEEEEQFS